MITSCIKAGATTESNSPTGMGSMGGGPSAQNFGPSKAAAPQEWNAVPQIISMIDEKARILLLQLPHEKQIDLSSHLLSKVRAGGVRDPTAWMTASCIKAGAAADTNFPMSGDV